jgi:cation-transporting ATPase F
VQALGQLALTYLPAMNTIFDTAPIGDQVWLRILAIAVAASLVVAVDPRLGHGHDHPRGSWPGSSGRRFSAG